MSSICIREGDIFNLDTDIIVNVTNSELGAGDGVCSAIFYAAGYEKMREACDEIGHCDTGSAVITPGFQLKAKHVIHMVEPIWEGGFQEEDRKFYNCYQEALKLAQKYECHSIGFPMFSSETQRYPPQRAWIKAIQACRDYLQENSEYDLKIYFAVVNYNMFVLGKNIILDFAPEFTDDIRAEHMILSEKTTRASRDDWPVFDMPEERISFTLHHKLYEEEIEVLKMGNIPQQTVDMWFWYCWGNTLYAYRSFTGCCIYIIQLNPGKSEHQVIANRNKTQNKFTYVENEEEYLTILLDLWAKPKYDYYRGWLIEKMYMEKIPNSVEK